MGGYCVSISILKREEERLEGVRREGEGEVGERERGKGRERGEGGRRPFVSVRCRGGSSCGEGTAFRSKI